MQYNQIVNLEILKKQTYLKTISLVLLLLCAQFSLAAHTHADDLAFEACSTCLIAEQAELDDVIPTSTNSVDHPKAQYILFSETRTQQVSNKRFHVFHLRGPPA